LDEIIVRLGRLEREAAGLHSDYVGLSLDAQLEQLRGAGCTRIYREKVTAPTTTAASFSRCSTTSPPATW